MSKVFEEYFNPDAIKLAFFRVKCWSDKLIKDRVGIRGFELELDRNCEALSEKILKQEYFPLRGFKFFVPKASLTTRTKILEWIPLMMYILSFSN